LRVYVEKLGASAENLSTEQAAVDLDLCSGIAKDLSPALDVVDVIPHTYNLEISSPGVERLLRGERDFIRFAGKKAKLKLTNPIRGQKVLVGILGPVSGGKLAVKDGGADYAIPLGDIEFGRLVFEFGAASRPGKPGSNGRKQQKSNFSKSSKSNK
jgi:ribosome maturation factor RimP